MKFLVITTKIPYPPYRGDKLKIYNICKLLLKQNEVKIITFYRNKKDIENLNFLINEGFNIEAIYLPFYLSVINLYRTIFTLIPFQVSAFHSKKMSRRIMELTSSVHYDVIYFHLIVTAQFLNSVRAAKSIKIIDFTDAMSLYLTRYLNFITNPIKKLIYKIELMRTSKYERIASKFDTLFVCSDRDKEYLMNKHIHMNTQILLNGVDTQTFRFKENTPEPNRIIFVGNMNYFPNIDAVKFFINEIFPIILKKKPEAKFYIIGPNPPGEILKLQQPNIIFKGFVNDLNNEYLLSSVNVVPVRLGAGIPNKIIEALVLGIPTVSSTLSASGLPGELKNLVLTADDSELFAEKVLDLFENNSFRADLINNGVSKVENLLSWTNIVTNFENYLKNRIQLTNGL